MNKISQKSHGVTIGQKIGLGAIILSGIWLFFKTREFVPTTKPLPPNTVEQILVDPIKRSIIIVKKEGTQKLVLPERPSKIDLGTDGKLTVTAPQFGVESLPFAGAGLSAGTSVILGVDLAYYKRLDLGVGWVVPTTESWAQDSRFALCVSYSVWHNTRVTGSVSTTGIVGAFVTVRF